MNETLRAATFIDKGGTGKTTVTAHLGVACARQGCEVLLIDLAGKQGDLAKHFGVWSRYQDRINADDAWPNISTVFRRQWKAVAEKLGTEAVDDLILRTDERVDIIPAHPDLDGLDNELANVDDATDRYSRLNRFLDEYIDSRRYDLVLIDLPGLSNNVTYNGLWAAEQVIVTVVPGNFEAEQAEQLRDELKEIRDTFSVNTELSMLVPNRVDQRTVLAEEYLEAFANEYQDVIAPEYVPDSQDVRNAADTGHTAFRLSSPSKTAREARNAFVQDAKALLRRLREGSDDVR
ncbi:ParA family protein [Haloferax volcanii]|uniref:ParA family protein n=1 Tax=Haloferax volcanii TaxID=2246 RepID=UPI003D30364D